MNQTPKDLGDLSQYQSLLVFGGCYSNLEASQALQQWAYKNKFEPEQCICTGDIVAYAANPVETVELIRSWGVHCIQGNVEESLAANVDHCGCGFDEGSMCDVLSQGWFPFADRAVGSADRQWFAQLPQQLSFSFAGKQYQVVHGAASDISRFMYASHADEEFLNEMHDYDIVISGHSGLPFTKKIGNKLWHNSGALGMPANDGTSRVWFSTIRLDLQEQIVIEHHNLNYNALAAQKSMLSNGLSQGYHQTLIDGLWPSMEVLPDKEKSLSGQAIVLDKIVCS